MTGTGTYSNPYIVNNWADFVTIDTANEVYVKWQDTENKVIDFNEIMPEGFSETVNFPAHVDFNGWTLRNFHSTAEYAIKINTSSEDAVQNLTIENLYTTSYYFMYGSFVLKNCMISGIAQPTGNVTFFNGCGLQNCSVNVRANAPNRFYLVNSGGFSSPKTQITNSDIIVDILCSTPEICNGVIKNSRISGKIQSNATTITLGSAYSMSNVFNLETSSNLVYNGNGVSIYNSDFANATATKNFIGVTSEQLKNAEYLYSIGFPIGVD